MGYIDGALRNIFLPFGRRTTADLLLGNESFYNF